MDLPARRRTGDLPHLAADELDQQFSARRRVGRGRRSSSYPPLDPGDLDRTRSARDVAGRGDPGRVRSRADRPGPVAPAPGCRGCWSAVRWRRSPSAPPWWSRSSSLARTRCRCSCSRTFLDRAATARVPGLGARATRCCDSAATDRGSGDERSRRRRTMIVLDQLVVGAAPGDAITSPRCCIRAALEQRRPERALRTAHRARAWRWHVRPLAELADRPNRCTPPRLPRQHRARGRSIRAIMAHEPRLVLVYHNFSPPEYYVEFAPEMAGDLIRGRWELGQLVRDGSSSRSRTRSSTPRSSVELGYRIGPGRAHRPPTSTGSNRVHPRSGDARPHQRPGGRSAGAVRRAAAARTSGSTGCWQRSRSCNRSSCPTHGWRSSESTAWRRTRKALRVMPRTVGLREPQFMGRISDEELSALYLRASVVPDPERARGLLRPRDRGDGHRRPGGGGARGLRSRRRWVTQASWSTTRTTPSRRWRGARPGDRRPSLRSVLDRPGRRPRPAAVGHVDAAQVPRAPAIWCTARSEPRDGGGRAGMRREDLFRGAALRGRCGRRRRAIRRVHGDGSGIARGTRSTWSPAVRPATPTGPTSSTRRAPASKRA